MEYIKNPETLQIIALDKFGEEFNHWIDLSKEEIDIFILDKKIEQLTMVRIMYLDGTDWYSARNIDEPNTYPEEIKERRILARKEIKEIKKATTLEQVQSYNEIFE